MNDSPAPQRSWLERLSQVFSSEPDSRETLIETLREAQRRGLLDNETLAMVEGAMQVSDRRVYDIMLPRSQIVWLPVDAPLETILERVIESGHSRFPVHGESRDDILGVLLAKDLLRCLADPSQSREIGGLLRPAVLIPESKRLNVLLKEFRDGRNHMALVVDEYGSVTGLVTIEDVLEQIVGEIDDETDTDGPEPVVRELEGQRWLVDALLPIAEFNERFGSAFSDEEVDTIGGIVAAAAGQVPMRGETYVVGGWSFRVTEGDARRAHRFLVTRETATGSSPS